MGVFLQHQLLSPSKQHVLPLILTGSSVTDLLKPATAATGGRVKKAGVCVKLWLAGIYFLVHAFFVASKLWIWQQFKDNKIKMPNMPNSMGLDTY